MSYLNRVWMATSVAVVNGHNDKGHKLKSGLRCLRGGRNRFSTSSSGAAIDPADLRPLSAMMESDHVGILGSGYGDERRKHADESLQQVLYMNCWGQS